jgi:single-strand DNA-binding protein
MASSAKKGMLLYVEGKISYRKYTDKDGIERQATDISASTVRSLDRKEGSGDTKPEQQVKRDTDQVFSNPTTPAAPQQAAPAQSSTFDDLPF